MIDSNQYDLIKLKSLFFCLVERAASPALSVRSRASRRIKHRTPSPSLPSSDADSESEGKSDERNRRNLPVKRSAEQATNQPSPPNDGNEDSLGPVPSPPTTDWQCEHCTFVNEPGVRVCAVCCRTPLATPKVVEPDVHSALKELQIFEHSDSRGQTNTKQNLRKDTINGKKSDSSKRATKTHSSSPSLEKQASNNRDFPPSTQIITVKSENLDRVQFPIRQDIAVGPSPPKELDKSRKNGIDKPSTQKHSVSVGPSPPRDPPNNRISSQTPPKKVEVTHSRDVETRPSRDFISTFRTKFFQLSFSKMKDSYLI